MSRSDHSNAGKRESGTPARETLDHDPLLARLAKSDPLQGVDLTGWTESSEGQDTLRRLLARVGEATPDLRVASASRRFFTRPRIYYGFGGAAIVALVFVVALVFCLRGEPNQVAISPTSTAAATTATRAAGSVDSPATTAGTPFTPHTTTTIGGRIIVGRAAARPASRSAGEVPSRDALASLLQVARLSAEDQGYRIPTYAETADDLVQEAVMRRILTAAEADELGLGEAVTRRRYALWLWRALGPRLPVDVAQTVLGDLATLSIEEEQAVSGLAAADIMRGDTHGEFAGDHPLTQHQEQVILGRVKAALDLR
jgi:hypothetical protein